MRKILTIMTICLALTSCASISMTSKEYEKKAIERAFYLGYVDTLEENYKLSNFSTEDLADIFLRLTNGAKGVRTLWMNINYRLNERGLDGKVDYFGTQMTLADMFLTHTKVVWMNGNFRINERSLDANVNDFETILENQMTLAFNYLNRFTCKDYVRTENKISSELTSDENIQEMTRAQLTETIKLIKQENLRK